MTNIKPHKIYLIVFADKLNNEKILECLNFDGNIGCCSIIYSPEFKYEFQELLTFLQTLDETSIKYPWKLHDIMLDDYPLTEAIDVVLDTNKRKYDTTHYAVFENLEAANQEFFDKVEPILSTTPEESFGCIAPSEDKYNGFLTSFSNFMVFNKNNQENLFEKIKNTKRQIIKI